MGVKMGWIQIKMGHPLARNGAALAPLRANGAHPIVLYTYDSKNQKQKHSQEPCFIVHAQMGLWSIMEIKRRNDGEIEW